MQNEASEPTGQIGIYSTSLSAHSSTGYEGMDETDLMLAWAFLGRLETGSVIRFDFRPYSLTRACLGIFLTSLGLE